jgi:hypothetical protein
MRAIRWMGHVARMGRRKIHTGILEGNVKKKNLEYLGVDGRITLKYILVEQNTGLY